MRSLFVVCLTTLLVSVWAFVFWLAIIAELYEVCIVALAIIALATGVCGWFIRDNHENDHVDYL